MPPPDSHSGLGVNPLAAVAPLEVVGHLSGLIDDMPVRVDCSGDEIAVHLPDLAAARRLSRTMTRSARLSRLQVLQPVLARTGLRLRIVVGGHPVARLDAASRGGLLANLLGVAPVELDLGAMIKLVLGRPAR